MRTLRSPLSLPSLAVLLTVAALGLTACSSGDEDTSETTATAPSAPILGDISDDGACDPEVIDIDHERPTMSLVHNVPYGYPEHSLSTMLHYIDPERAPQSGGGGGSKGGSGGGVSRLITEFPNADIDFIEVTATATDEDGNDVTETCTIDVA